MLLQDVRRIFAERDRDTITTADLIEALVAMEDRPWPEWGRAKKPITPHALAKLLDPFNIAPKQFWDSGKHRGYTMGQFNDAFSRYLGDSSGITVEPSASPISSASHPVGAKTDLPERNAQKPSKNPASTGLPDQKPGAGQEALCCAHCGGPDVPDNDLLECHGSDGIRRLHRDCIDRDN